MIEKLLEPFSLSLGLKQDAGTLLKHLKRNNVSTDELIDYVNDLKEESAKIAEQWHPELIGNTG